MLTLRLCTITTTEELPCLNEPVQRTSTMSVLPISLASLTVSHPLSCLPSSSPNAYACLFPSPPSAEPWTPTALSTPSTPLKGAKLTFNWNVYAQQRMHPPSTLPCPSSSQRKKGDGKVFITTEAAKGSKQDHVRPWKFISVCLCLQYDIVKSSTPTSFLLPSVVVLTPKVST